MDSSTSYQKYLHPHATALLILEYVSIPALSLAAYAVGGKPELAIAAAASWLLADAFFTLLIGHSLLGIYTREPPPVEKKSFFKPGGTFNRIIGLMAFALIAVFSVELPLQGGLLITWFFYFMMYWAGFNSISLINAKPSPLVKYDKQLLLFGAFLILPLLLTIALQIQDRQIIGLIGVIEIVWAVIVAYFAYRMIVKKQWMPVK